MLDRFFNPVAKIVCWIHSFIQIVSGQIRINLYAPGVDATRHGPDMLKTVTREIRGCIQAPDAVMANENDLPIFRPFGHDLLHQLLGEKRGALDVNSVPFFPAPNINQWDLLARSQPFGDFCGRNLHFLIRIVGGKNGGDHLVHRKIVVARANRCQSFIRTEAAARAAADVVRPGKGLAERPGTPGEAPPLSYWGRLFSSCSQLSALHHFTRKSKGPTPEEEQFQYLRWMH